MFKHILPVIAAWLDTEITDCHAQKGREGHAARGQVCLCQFGALHARSRFEMQVWKGHIRRLLRVPVVRKNFVPLIAQRIVVRTRIRLPETPLRFYTI